MKIIMPIIMLLIYVGSVVAIPVDISSDRVRLLVDEPWLRDRVNDDHLVIIDGRSSELYQQGHIPNSVNIPVGDTFNPKVSKDRLASSKYIQVLFSDAGIDYQHTVVIYDSGEHVDAGRLFWVFEVFGHDNVKLLRGGYPSWVKNKHNLISTMPRKVVKSHYIPRLEPQRLTTKLSMQLAIDDDNLVIIDARTAQEFTGKESSASRFGHIPKAMSIPWTENFTEKDGVVVLKQLEELKKMYAHIDKSKKIYLYCNKGKQSSLSYTIMRQLGYDAAPYDGSWFEWGNDNRLPIE